MRKLELHWQILIAILFAGVAGWGVNSAMAAGVEDPSILGISLIGLFDYIGSLFLNALKMIIVPLIFSSIVIGVATTALMLSFIMIIFRHYRSIDSRTLRRLKE